MSDFQYLKAYKKAYAAGVIDVKGYIGLSGVAYPRPRITVTTRNKEALDMLHELYGGNVYRVQGESEAYRWQLQSKKAILACLQDVGRMLVAQKAQARLLALYCMAKPGPERLALAYQLRGVPDDGSVGF